MNLKKIGVLLPMSKAFPKMGKEFLNGLKLSLNKEEVILKVEGIGFGTDSKLVINNLQKLVNQEDVQITTGLLGHYDLKEILNFVESTEEPLIYSDLGATKPISLTDKKYVWCNSLDLYGSTLKLGQYFLENNLNNIGLSSCYYDAGYGFIEAMEKALYDNKKGQFAGHYITPMKPRKNEAEIMSEFVKQVKADAIFAFHNGIYAEEHAAFLKENRINEITPLYATPFTIDDKILNQFPDIFHGTRSLTTWSESLDSKENKKFIKEYKASYDKIPSVFALLGYENGILIADFLNKKTKPEKTELKGPRGSLKTNSLTHRTSFEQHLLELIYENGKYNKIIKEKRTPYKHEIKGEENNQIGGWQNAYLCH